MSYRVTIWETALGKVIEFHGPGLPRYANGVHFMQPTNEWAEKCMAERPGTAEGDYADHEAARVLGFLHAAYEAGKEARSKEILALLGGERKI